MKSERLVSLLLLLQSRSPRPARELATTMGVSMRTIYRDVEALGFSGVPVYAERGSTGGIALSDGYRRAIAQFSTDELSGLFASASEPLSDIGVTGHTLALHKIHGALPDLQRHAAEKARQRILLDHRKWYRPPQPSEVLATLRRAVWDDCIVEITYRDRYGTVTQRIIHPLGLVAKAGVWYVVAASNGEMRSFRADRIVTASETGECFSRPGDFDLERYWDATMTSMERIPEARFDAELAVEHEAIEMLAPYFPCETIDTAGATLRVRVRFPSRAVAESQIMMISARVKHIEDDELRAAVAERARALLEVLGTPAG